jgi:hypothetical protein
MDLKLGFQFRPQRQEVQMVINSIEVTHSLGLFLRGWGDKAIILLNNARNYPEADCEQELSDLGVCSKQVPSVTGTCPEKPGQVALRRSWPNQAPSGCLLLCSQFCPWRCKQEEKFPMPFISFDFQSEQHLSCNKCKGTAKGGEKK